MSPGVVKYLNIFGGQFMWVEWNGTLVNNHNYILKKWKNLTLYCVHNHIEKNKNHPELNINRYRLA